jgi:hypothetical protein
VKESSTIEELKIPENFAIFAYHCGRNLSVAQKAFFFYQVSSQQTFSSLVCSWMVLFWPRNALRTCGKGSPELPPRKAHWSLMLVFD